jgi:hypothetical protein
VEGPSRRERSERRDSDVHRAGYGTGVRGYFRDSVRNPVQFHTESVQVCMESVQFHTESVQVRTESVHVRTRRFLGVFLYIYIYIISLM